MSYQIKNVHGTYWHPTGWKTQKGGFTFKKWADANWQLKFVRSLYTTIIVPCDDVIRPLAIEKDPFPSIHVDIEQFACWA